MGTRHRAGIGITEETDAIAVIVSEETGAISMAVGGKIERDLSVEHLRELLSMELRRYMSPVALPTVGPQGHDPDAGEESTLRARAPMGADGDDDAETERPL
jgi:diadenylate cyclase